MVRLWPTFSPAPASENTVRGGFQVREVGVRTGQCLGPPCPVCLVLSRHVGLQARAKPRSPGPGVPRLRWILFMPTILSIC